MANGYYEFTNLMPGTYAVSEVLQPDWTQSYPASGNYTGIVLESGDSPETSYDFANWDPVDPSGVKYHDQNANGAIDPGEPGLSGWKIRLEGTTGWGESCVDDNHNRRQRRLELP